MMLIRSRYRFLLLISSLIVLCAFLILPRASADEGGTQQRKDADQLTPQGILRETPSLPQHNQKPSSESPIAPSAPENQGARNPRTGEYYPPAGKGAINPRTGECYPPSGQGFINPRTGAYYPHANH